MDPDRPARWRPAPARPEGAVRALVVAVVGLVALALGVGAWLVVPPLVACGGGERRAFAELAHYGGVRVEPEGHPDAGSCAGFYRAPATRDQVLAHYRGQLARRGWTLEPARTTSQDPRLEAGELRAHRDGLTCTVLYESGPGLRGGGTHVAVHVSGG